MAGLSFRRGDVYWVNLDPTIGTEINIAAVDEQTGYHPGPGGLGLGAVGALVRWCAPDPQHLGNFGDVKSAVPVPAGET